MRRSQILLVGALVGCAADSASSGGTTSSTGMVPGASTSSGGADVSTGARPTSSETTSADDSGSSSTGPSGPPDHVPPGFLNPNDWGGVGVECSQWLEDCPPGEKCMPYSNDGGNAWNAMRCSPVVPDPAQPGEPCTVEGSGVSGIDNCDFHSMCWDVDPDTLEGTCVAMCVGAEAAPACAESGHSCSVDGSGTLTLCLPVCDPLAQDCAPTQGCYYLASTYACAPDASGEGGAPFTPCEFTNGCDPGSLCGQSPACEGGPNCCVPFCSLSEPDCPETTSCIPAFSPGEEPVGLGDVGFCGGTP